MTTDSAYRREAYISRINRVIDFIEANIGGELRLKDLAGVAHFSPFHFHRIFSAMVGEMLNQFIQRIRIEKAAAKLAGNPKKSITAIAIDCGFSSSAAFSRAFREAFSMSPSQWRNGEYLGGRKDCSTNSKTNQTIGKIGKDFEVSALYIDGDTKKPTWRVQMKDKRQVRVQVKEMPEFNVAYVRHIGPYKGDAKLFEALFNKLMTWAGPRDLLRFPETKILAVYHDDPEITDEDRLRVSACITVPKETPVEGEIGTMTIPGGKYAVGRFELTAEEYQGAWDAIFGGWLPDSGYQPDDRPCYELFPYDGGECSCEKRTVDICVPVKPMP